MGNQRRQQAIPIVILPDLVARLIGSALGLWKQARNVVQSSMNCTRSNAFGRADPPASQTVIIQSPHCRRQQWSSIPNWLYRRYTVDAEVVASLQCCTVFDKLQ